MASFFSSLIQGYSGTLIQKHKDDLDRKERQMEMQLQNLRIAAEVRERVGDYQGAVEATSQAEEITKQYIGAGKKKGGFSLGNLIGRFSDDGGQSKSGAAGGGKGGAPQGQSQAGAAGAAPGASPTPVSLGQPPARPHNGGGAAPMSASASPVSLGAPPTRGEIPFKTSVEKVTKEEEAKIAAMDAADKKKIQESVDLYKKMHPQATEQEIYDKVIAPLSGIKVDNRLELEQMKQEFTALRDQNKQVFQLQFERMRESAAERHQNAQAEIMMRALGMRLSMQDRERMKITPAQINTEINSTLNTMRQNLNLAAKNLNMLKSSAQKRNASLWQQMISEDPKNDISQAQSDLNHQQAAMNYFEKHRAGMLSGKVDMQDVIDQAEMIAIQGSDEAPKGEEQTGEISP